MRPASLAPVPRHGGARPSLAWPLALGFAALVVYASLYPFEGWRVQDGVSAWAYLAAPWPRYWTGFDVAANLLGYLPLGALLTLALARSAGAGARRAAPWAGLLLPALLSLLLEALQGFLPMRVPSRLDALLNAAGAGLGVLLALALLRSGLLRRWVRLRELWLADAPTGSLAVLAAWPLALLYPSSVPFGLGQVWERLLQQASEALADLPSPGAAPLAGWLTAPAAVAAPMAPLTEAVAVATGLIAPCLLAYALLGLGPRRLLAWALWLALALAAAALSAALTYGPEHAWAWLAPPVWLGMGLAALLALPLALAGPRSCALLMLLALTFSLGLLNASADSPYLQASLAEWEQGRFIRFHGLSQWLGWLWPYAALWVGARLLLRRQGPAYNRGP